MRTAVIFYHSNIDKLYEPQWIAQCVDSIYAQTYGDSDVFELNYGKGGKKYTNGKFFNLKLDNHIEAMNFLISGIFGLGYDVIFNTNADDYYCPTRFEKQIAKIKEGYHLVSSNFQYIGESDKYMDMVSKGDIGANLQKDHNIIAHPVVAIHRNFWTPDLHYNNLVGYEDLDLWQRAHKKGKKFFILEDCLLYYRIHKSQITKSYGINGKK